jgi:hypothetical protein
MATRPAPRKSTRDERAFLASVRRAARNKNISMTDVYNYERTKNEQFNQGLSSARGLEGMVAAQPTVSAEKVTASSDPVSRGILNTQTQGRNMEGLFGDQVNPFGQKVDPAAQRKYRETFGRNPLYKFTFDKDSQRESNVYANIQEPDVMTELAKAIPTDFATSVDKLVRGVSGDRANTSSLFTLGGRLANKGEFAYESRKGDKSGIADDLLNAANVATYLVGGSGVALKGAGAVAKAGKGYNAASTLNKAAKMGRVTNTLDIGVPISAQTAPSVIDNPKAAGIAGGTGAAVLAGLLTRGKGAKAAAATTAAALGGAGLASSTVPEQAQAWNPKVLFNLARTDKNILTKSWNDLPQELKISLSEAAYKQNSSTWKRIKKFAGAEAKKEEWMQDGRGISGEDMWEEAKNFFNASEFTDEAGMFTDDGINLAELALPGKRSRSLQWSHIRALEEAASKEPFIAQGSGSAIFTWPRVNRSMGSQNMIEWLKRPDIDKETKLQIIAQLGDRAS